MQVIFWVLVVHALIFSGLWLTDHTAPACNRCGRTWRVRLATFCTTCGEVWLCRHCWNFHAKELEAEAMLEQEG